ncbi:hypothetical protein [Bacillus cereus group sp. RP43]|uniref:AbiU2 domain-containing protein n=1 Tax=Bacillus cereus group sp. RP43 TaxID=3040260 RepID=UPI003397DFD1
MSGYDKEKIKQLINRFMFEIINVRSKFQLWKHIQKHRNEHLDELNIAPAFFTLTLHSVFNDVIITLAKLYEHGKQTANLNKLINIADANRALFDYKEHAIDPLMITNKEIENHKKIIEEKEESLNNLFMWRDKVYAHNDMKYFFDKEQLPKDAELTMQHIEELIEKAWEIVNFYSLALEGKAWHPDSPDTLDIEKVFSILKNFKEEKNREIDVFLMGAGLKRTQ